MQGSLGLTPVEGGWLTAIYSMTSVCMSMLLIKFRQQFGMQRFTRLFLMAFLVLNVLQLFVHSYGVQLIVRGAAGVAGSALTTLCFLYIMQALPAAARLSGMIIGFGASQVALPLARTLSPLLLADGRIEALFLLELGLTLMCLGSVALLRLPPSDRTAAFERIDFLTFALFAPGVALLCAVLVQGRIQWWSTPWLGYATAAAIPLIGGALLIEHNRANPLLNTRWMLGRNIVRFAVVAASLRILLSEQTFGTVGLLTAVGMGNDQLVTLSLIMTLASIAGIVVSLKTLNMQDLYKPVVIAVALIGIGAWMDADLDQPDPAVQLLRQPGDHRLCRTLFSGPDGDDRHLPRAGTGAEPHHQLFGDLQHHPDAGRAGRHRAAGLVPDRAREISRVRTDADPDRHRPAGDAAYPATGRGLCPRAGRSGAAAGLGRRPAGAAGDARGQYPCL
ncbi:hypothetical protein [Sphingomonas hankookensis]|uniref:hypothetical protein n=1 Tax=Sphingomonas hankookensis TaxID=563996 RepID=UPI003D303B3B